MIIITIILNDNIIHSQNTKVFQVVLNGWDHQCQNQPVKKNFFCFKVIKAFQLGVQTCSVVRDEVKLFCLQKYLCICNNLKL